MAAPSNNLPGKILIVDDDVSVAQGIEKGLKNYHVNIQKALDLETAMYQFKNNRFDAVLVELEFGPLPGLALIQKWRSDENIDKRATAFILLCGQQRDSLDEGLIRELGDVDLLNKPFSLVQVLPFLSRSVACRRKTSEFEEFKEKILNHYVTAEKFDKAAEVLKKRLKEFGPKGLDMLVELYEKAGRFEEALKLVSGMLETQSEDISLINAKGRLLLRLKLYDEAAFFLEKADKIAPKKIDRINEMASMYLQLNRPKDSIAKFQQVLDLSPESPDIKFEMYAKLYEFGFDEEAQEFGKKTAKPMEIVRHYNNKGVMLSKSGKIDEALIEYKRAIKFYPKFKENYRIHFNISLAYTAQKSRDSYGLAESHLKTCLSLSPTFDKAKKTLEVVQKALGKKEAV